MSENNEKAWKNAKKEGIVTEDDKKTTSNFLINFFKSIVIFPKKMLYIFNNGFCLLYNCVVISNQSKILLCMLALIA